MKFNFNFKNAFIKTIIIFLASAFILTGIINFFVSIDSDDLIKIGSKKIGYSFFYRYLNNVKNQYITSDMKTEELEYINSNFFVRDVLKNFIDENLLVNQINKLKIKAPKEAVFYEIYNSDYFIDKEGKFNERTYRKSLEDAKVSEMEYIDYVSDNMTKNIYLHFLLDKNLLNKFILNPIFKRKNTYALIDLITIYPDNDLNIKEKFPTKIELKEYYDKNKSTFTLPQEKIFSYIEINLDNTDSQTQLSQLEDFILSAKNMDELAKHYKVDKKIFKYTENLSSLPNDFDKEILQYDVGTFSKVIYTNNLYKIYYVENITPSKTLSLKEATPDIIKILQEKNKKEEYENLMENLSKQIKKDGFENTAIKNSLKIEKNINVYEDSLSYPAEFISDIYLNKKDFITEPIYDSDRNVYFIAKIKNFIEMDSTNINYHNFDSIKNEYVNSYSMSIIALHQKYLENSEKVIINTKLIENLNSNN